MKAGQIMKKDAVWQLTIQSNAPTNAVPLVSLLFSPNLIWKTAPYFPNMSYSSSAVIRNGKLRTYNIRLTSGGSLDCEAGRVAGDGKEREYKS